MILAATTDKFQLVTSAAANVDVHVSFIDASSTTLAPSGGGKQNTNIVTATTTDILAAPAASTLRTVTKLIIRNKHASVATDVTVVFDQAATDFELHKVTLQPGEALEYLPGLGWFHLKPAAKLDKLLATTADVTNATTSFADITGLSQAVESGKTYTFFSCLRYDTNATTTGARFGANGPASPTAFWIGQDTASTPGIAATNIATEIVTAFDTAISLSTTGPGTTDSIVYIGGVLVPSAAGTFAMRFASEVAVASALIVRRGSWLMIREADNT